MADVSKMERRANALTWCRGLAGVLAIVFTASPAWSAAPAGAPPRPMGPGGREAYEERAVTFVTSDGVYIYGTYFPSTGGRDTAPVICLHQLRRDRRDFIRLARLLQRNGFAVLTIDLRGHGQSKSVNLEVYRFHWRKGVQQLREQEENPLLNAERFQRADYERMLRDVEAGKRFLIKEHNDGKLNIGKLAVVGASIGSTAAIRHAAYDWGFPKPKGQDVNALVLLSPGYNYRGVSIVKALPRVAGSIPLLTIVGTQDRESYNSAKRIANLAKRGGSTLSRLVELKTNMHGTSLLVSDFRVKLYPLIVKWLQLATSQIMPPPRWEKRELPAQFE